LILPTLIKIHFKQNHPFYKAVKARQYAAVSKDIEMILNQPATDLKQYIKDYKHIFKMKELL